MVKFCGPNNLDKNISYFIRNYSNTYTHKHTLTSVGVFELRIFWLNILMAKSKRKTRIFCSSTIHIFHWLNEKYGQSHAAWYKFEFKKNALCSFTQHHPQNQYCWYWFNFQSRFGFCFDVCSIKSRAHIIMIILFCIQFAFNGFGQAEMRKI